MPPKLNSRISYVFSIHRPSQAKVNVFFILAYLKKHMAKSDFWTNCTIYFYVVDGVYVLTYEAHHRQLAGLRPYYCPTA